MLHGSTRAGGGRAACSRAARHVISTLIFNTHHGTAWGDGNSTPQRFRSRRSLTLRHRSPARCACRAGTESLSQNSRKVGTSIAVPQEKSNHSFVDSARSNQRLRVLRQPPEACRHRPGKVCGPPRVEPAGHHLPAHPALVFLAEHFQTHRGCAGSPGRSVAGRTWSVPAITYPHSQRLWFSRSISNPTGVVAAGLPFAHTESAQEVSNWRAKPVLRRPSESSKPRRRP